MQKRFQTGFTMIELSIAMLIAMGVLAATLQLMNQSNQMFVRVKDRSDRMVDAALAREQLDFYMERWGKGVFSVADAVPQGEFPPQQSSVHHVQTNVLVKSDGTEVSNPDFDSFSFLGNLEGYAVVDSTDTTDNTKVNLLSCRLQSGAATDATSGCYTILRNKDYWQPGDVYLRMEERKAETTHVPTNPLDFDKSTIAYAVIDGLASTASNQCIDTGNQTPNFKANRVISFADGLNSNITLYEEAALQPGDFIQPLPQRLRIFVQQNAEDQNAPWLYISSTPLTDCPNSLTEIAAISPVRSFKLNLDTPNVLKVSLNMGYSTERLRNQSQVPPLELEYYYD
ncbi:MAG: type II secretion system protein [Candidatus Sericytochromatia bacterium]|nr:type II secretion system protein [Candidatus Sericytochromatia bacterium]